MNKTHNLMTKAKEKGITIKYLSQLTDININTLYNYSSGKRNLSKDKELKLQTILSKLIKD